MEGFTPRRILVGTDFSEVSTWVLRHAVMWMQRYQAHLTILHVQQLPWVMDDPQFGGRPRDEATSTRSYLMTVLPARRAAG